MPEVIVAGSGGQLGYELLRAHWPEGVRVAGPPFDITDAAAVARAVASADLLINAAAYTAVDRAEDEPERAFAVNRDGTRVLAQACAARGIPLLHVSTDYVFDGTKSTAYTEDDPVNPVGVYGASKLAGEVALREVLPEHVIVRTAWVFGAHGHNFVKTMLRLGAERDVLHVVNDQRGCPTPAADLAWALIRVATQVLGGDAHFGTFHFTGAPVTTWCGFARAILAGKPVRVDPIATKDYPTRAVRPANSELDCTRITHAYGAAPRPWRDGLAAVLKEIS